MTTDSSYSSQSGFVTYEPVNSSGANSTAPGILVVDDDSLLLPLLQTILARRGFRVWMSSSGNQAIEVYRQHHKQIDVVLLDVRMPMLDGPSTLKELQKINPKVCSCFMSGHIGEYREEDLYALGCKQLFAKPFQIHTLPDDLWQIARTAKSSTESSAA